MYKILVFLNFFMVSWCMGQPFVPFKNNLVFKSELKEKSLHIHTLEADFTESVFSSLLKDPKTAKGNLIFSTDNKLKWAKTIPYDEVIISDGADIKIIRDGELVKDEGTKRVFKKMESLMNELFTASFLESEQFNLSYFENEASVSIVLNPKRKNMAKRISHIKLIFNKQTLALANLSIYENTVDYVDYSFTNVKYNADLDSKLFTDY
jgi:outer membrane lipoprotein-sorting protein